MKERPAAFLLGQKLDEVHHSAHIHHPLLIHLSDKTAHAADVHAAFAYFKSWY